MVDGDEAAFLALYRARQSAIYRFAFHMCGSSAIAEDVTQEVFMALLKQARDFDSRRGTLVNYLFGIARHQVRRAVGQTSSESELPDEEEAAPPEGRGEDPLLDLARRETVTRVRAAIATLPLHYREVIVLCDLEELDYATAAERLEQPVGTVRSRLHRARQLLLRKLQPGGTPATNRQMAPARVVP
jgi:RNA polymerase sigma-70 factor (ECF subfamily)